MTTQQRVTLAMAGKPVDSCPVAALYLQLYHQDHFTELTGLPEWMMHRWLCASPEEHLATLRLMADAAPFDILQPQGCAPLAWRARQEFIERDSHPYRHDRETDEWVRLDAGTVSGHPVDYAANEAQFVFDRSDIREKMPVTPATEIVSSGRHDYAAAVSAAYAGKRYLLTGGVIGTVYSAGWYVGQTNLLAMLVEAPSFVDELCARILEINIEQIRSLAAVGGDAIYIDDATATSDMISVSHYERYSLPYMRAMTQEIHALRKQAILIYFGGVMDRLEQLAAIGADGLLVETSMKGYDNDLGEITRRIGDRVTLFGNLDPIGVLQNGTDEELTREISRQVTACRQARGFIISPASPITPRTPISRVRGFIEQARILGKRAKPVE